MANAYRNRPVPAPVRLRDGTGVESFDRGGRVIGALYGSAVGRRALKVLVKPGVSNLAGNLLDSPLSRPMVRRFVRRNGLDMTDYPDRRYYSFNDFFTRTIREGARPVENAPERLPSPCDGKLTVFPLREDTHFTVKGVDYTLATLLRSRELAERFRGGWGLLLRLSVDDYHRYSYPVSGVKGENVRIPGVYHTVNTRAAAARPIYRENTREYTLISTEHCGCVLMMEVGAMLVGRIRNLDGPGPVERGREKGYFEFGGSSILLLFEKDRFTPDEDIRQFSERGEETVVKLGEAIGTLN